MSDTNQKILDMIISKKTANEICSETGLSNKQLFHRLNMLKIKGYNFSRKYYYNGNIVYKLDKGFTTEKDIALMTTSKDQEFKAIFISDLHLSSEKERLDLLDEAYNLGIKENIHIIINCGDFINGLIGPGKKKHKTYEDQIEYALKIHPFDKNILNFICLGNHDYKSLETTGQNIKTALEYRRHDIVPLGYGSGTLKIKNDEIIVTHPETPKDNNIGSVNHRLILIGHTHVSKTKTSNNGNVSLYIPSLSDLSLNQNGLPSLIKATISFNQGYFDIGDFEQFVFVSKHMYKVNESRFILNLGRKKGESTIMYEENFVDPMHSEEPETTQKVLTKPSQIEKFNNKYRKS